MQEKKELTMKEQVLELVNGIRTESDIDLRETPVVFQWSYDELPDISLQLMIQEGNPNNHSVH